MVLSYRHAFHAGNHADVLKHSIVSLMISHFTRPAIKANNKVSSSFTHSPPFFFLDTHAGAGIYRVQPNDTQVGRKNELERRIGLDLVWQANDAPNCLSPYLFALRALNGFYPVTPPHAQSEEFDHQDRSSSTLDVDQQLCEIYGLPSHSFNFDAHAYDLNSLHYLVGSPALFTSLARPNDRLLCFELHSTDQKLLHQFLQDTKSSMAASPRPSYCSFVHNSMPQVGIKRSAHAKVLPGKSGFDAYFHIPPIEARGMILVDPPYELSSEHDDAAAFVARCLKRWPIGSLILWYPLLAGPKAELSVDMLKNLTHSAAGTTTLNVTLQHDAMDARAGGSERVKEYTSLQGSGLLLFNPPPLMREVLESSLLPYLVSILSTNTHRFSFDISSTL